MTQNFVACDREQELLLPPSLREWLPEAHLAALFSSNHEKSDDRQRRVGRNHVLSDPDLYHSTGRDQQRPHTRVRYLSVVSQGHGEVDCSRRSLGGLRSDSPRCLADVEVVSCTSDELVLILDLRTSRGPLTCGRALGTLVGRSIESSLENCDRCA